MTQFRTVIAAFAVAIALNACTGMAMKKEASLYDRLGGKPAITAVIDDFAGADIPHLKRMLVDQVCAASGGPCTYTGRDMASAHRGMNISEGELLAALGGLKGDIVGR